MSKESGDLEPDHLIEKFWLNFKVSMTNFYRLNPTYTRPIVLWSNILNEYKKNKNYDKIQETIYQYITLYMLDIMRNGNNHHSNLLNSFLKRWQKLCDQVSFFDFDKEVDLNYQIFRIYLKMSETETAETNILFKQPELYIYYRNFTPLIKFGVENDKSSIIDRVNTIADISEILFKLYGYTGNTKMSGIKLIQRIKRSI